MKASQRLEQYVIGGIAIFVAATALLPRTLLPGWINNLIPVEFGWLMLTGVCLAAVGMVWEWAKRRQNNSLLWLMAPPVAVLAYEAWSFLKLLTVGLLKEVKEVTLGQWLLFIWVIVTLRFWYQRNEYREQLESAERALERQPSRCPHCGAHV